MTTHTRNRLALFIVCAPRVTADVGGIAARLGNPVADMDALARACADQSVTVTGSVLDVNRWRHAATTHDMTVCVLSLSGHLRTSADVSAWPRMATAAVGECRRHVGFLAVDDLGDDLERTVHAQADPRCVDCGRSLQTERADDVCIVAPPCGEGPARLALAHVDCDTASVDETASADDPGSGVRGSRPTIADLRWAEEAETDGGQTALFGTPQPPPRQPSEPDPVAVEVDRPQRSAESLARQRSDATDLERLKSWEVHEDGSCCRRCPLCGVSVGPHVGWHLHASGGHAVGARPALATWVRHHFRSHIERGCPTEALIVARRILEKSPFSEGPPAEWAQHD